MLSHRFLLPFPQIGEIFLPSRLSMPVFQPRPVPARRIERGLVRRRKQENSRSDFSPCRGLRLLERLCIIGEQNGFSQTTAQRLPRVAIVVAPDSPASTKNLTRCFPIGALPVT